VADSYRRCTIFPSVFRLRITFNGYRKPSTRSSSSFSFPNTTLVNSTGVHTLRNDTMKIGVLTQEKYLKNGIQTFEANLIPYLLEDERFEPIFHTVNNDYPLSRTLQTLKLRKKVKRAGSDYDKIFIPAQNRLRFDPREVEAEVVPYVHDVLPHTTNYSTGRNKIFRPIIDAAMNFLDADYLPHLSHVDRAITASYFSRKELDQRTSFSGHATTIYQGVDDMPEPDFENDRDIDLLYVGIDLPRKNPRLLRKSLEKAEEEGYNVATVNFEETDFPGESYTNISNEKLAELYERSRFYLHPSYLEGFGRGPVEAQRYGAVPLALDNDINNEILGEDEISFFHIHSVRDVLYHLKNGVRPRNRSLAYSNSRKYRWSETRKKVKEVLLE